MTQMILIDTTMDTRILFLLMKFDMDISEKKEKDYCLNLLDGLYEECFFADSLHLEDSSLHLEDKIHFHHCLFLHL